MIGVKPKNYSMIKNQFTVDEIRKKWLVFFQSKGYYLIESASLIPQNDPSLL